MAPVVLEMDVHCDGCARKIRKAIKNMPGVGRVSASVDAGQVVVEGTADAAALQARLQAKLRKAVTIVSDGAEPAPENDPPAPENEPPAPENEPPAPENDPPAPENDPPAPENDPPAPHDPSPPPMGGGYQPYWHGWMPPPPQYAPPPPPQYAPPAPWGYYHPYGCNPSATYDHQYVPNDGPTFFSDENPNGCSIQ